MSIIKSLHLINHEKRIFSILNIISRQHIKTWHQTEILDHWNFLIINHRWIMILIQIKDDHLSVIISKWLQLFSHKMSSQISDLNLSILWIMKMSLITLSETQLQFQNYSQQKWSSDQRILNSLNWILRSHMWRSETRFRYITMCFSSLIDLESNLNFTAWRFFVIK